VIRGRIAERRQELDELAPEAVDLAAAVTAAVHEALYQQVTALRGDRTPRYWRGVLLGEHALAIEDLARLAYEAPEAIRRALDLLEHAVGRQAQDEPGSAGTVAREGADVARTGGELMAAVVLAAEDDRVDVLERENLLAKLAAHKREVAELEAAVARGER
jgi:hypothetical protein